MGVTCKLAERKIMLIKTQKENFYLLSRGISQVLLLHPILAYLIKLNESGVDLKNWINSFENNYINFENKKIKVDKDIIRYYYEYFMFLKEHNYFNSKKTEELKKVRHYHAENIKFYLANTDHISFEVTDSCNMKCVYCGYGELYNGYDKRRGKKLSIKIGKKVIDYIMTLKKEYFSFIKTHRKIAVSFYGGEPLLNFSFIKEMVDYVKGIKLPTLSFIFSITTNGTLLNKYMDFFVENNFLLLISLDGNKENNEYRIFPDHTPSYEIVYNNALRLKNKYPEYFEKFVNFISVIHNKNSPGQVLKYFKETFNKRPIILGLSGIGIKPEKRKDYEKIKRKTIDTEIKELPIYYKDIKLSEMPKLKGIENFIKVYSGFVYDNIDSFLYNKNNINYITTGTCNPFEKKVFITVNGKILPCERIMHKYFCGRIEGEKINLDFQEIADKYNKYYEKMDKLCNNCYNNKLCGQCIFQLNLEEKRVRCDNFLNYNDFLEKSSFVISLLEEMPQLYKRSIRNLEIESEI